MQRIITFDLKNGSPAHYQEIYDALEQFNATMLTESSYAIDADVNQNTIISAIKKVIYSDDVVYYISVNKDSKLFYVKI